MSVITQQPIREKMKEEPKYNKSENDSLFFEIFGYYPAKAGKAYEILSTAAYAIATRASNAVLDTRVRGKCGALHQLDGRLMVADDDVQLEAKDYKSKIGIGKISEVKGRLSDLPVDRAVYAAKQYTKPARQFAKGTFDNGDKKGVTLLDIRKSKNKDLIGRIGTIKVKISVPPFPDMSLIDWCFTFSPSTERIIANDGIDIQSEKDILIVDDKDLDKAIIPEFEKDALNKIRGKSLNDGDLILGHLQNQGLYAQLSNGRKYPIEDFYYRVPICIINDETEVKPNGKPVIYIKSDDGTIDKLITDKDLLEWGKQNGITKE